MILYLLLIYKSLFLKIKINFSVSEMCCIINQKFSKAYYFKGLSENPLPILSTNVNPQHYCFNIIIVTDNIIIIILKYRVALYNTHIHIIRRGES